MLWIISFGLFAVWLVLLLMGKGGFIHLLILNAIPIAIVKYLANRRASQTE
jgi:hypothetical protein